MPGIDDEHRVGWEFFIKNKGYGAKQKSSHQMMRPLVDVELKQAFFLNMEAPG